MRALVIAPEERWFAAIRHLLPADADIVPCSEELLLRSPSISEVADLAFVCTGELGTRCVETIKAVRRATAVPILVFCDQSSGEWEEEVMLAGAQQVFAYPLRAKLVDLALRRLLPTRTALTVTRAPALVPAPAPARKEDSGEVLSVLREVSRSMVEVTVGTYFLEPYLRKLREVMGCGRLILYVLEQNSTRNLSCVFVTGADPELFSAIRLSRTDGTARIAEQRGCVLLRSRLREHEESESVACREMDVFGAELCVPLISKDGLVGALFLGRRISGADYSDSELIMLFHLMEELGGLIRNHASHAELLRERKLFASVLATLPVGCAVVDTDLQILHANPTMQRVLGVSPSTPLRFEHLPQTWAAAVYGVLQQRHPNALLEVPHSAGERSSVLRLRVAPVTDDESMAKPAALLTVEDITHDKRALEDSTTGAMRALMERAGEQLSNEFRNALTPISTLLHFSSENQKDMPELSGAVSAGMHRLRRRIDELAYLARRALLPERSNAAAILRAARERFEGLVDSGEAKSVVWPAAAPEVEVVADSKALGLGIAELLLNAVEADHQKPVHLSVETDGSTLRVRIVNEGRWTPFELAGFSSKPFVTAKAEGVGIGLEVAMMVAANHGGKVTLNPKGENRIEALFEVPLHSPDARL